MRLLDVRCGASMGMLHRNSATHRGLEVSRVKEPSFREGPLFDKFRMVRISSGKILALVFYMVFILGITLE